MPLFFLAVAAIVILNYASQEETTLRQARSSATLQAMSIKESLVNMMTTNLEVDEEFLKRISKVGEIVDLQVWYRSDSLRLMQEYATPERMTRLREREARLHLGDSNHAAEVFRTGNPLWILSCNLGKHEDQSLDVLTHATPMFLSSCEELTAVVPFTAERKCRQCHAVQVGHVLGAAHMTIPLSRTAEALRANAFRSITIFIIFSVLAVIIGLFVFSRFVSRPLQRLVGATTLLGEGNFDHDIVQQFDKDEFGTLAAAFDEMLVKLKEVQRQLVIKERLSTVGQMASSIIHDFRSPMTGISLAIERLQKSEAMTPDQRNDLYNMVRLSIDRMNRMMQELLDFSRGEVKLNHSECNIEEFTSSVARSVDLDMQRKEIKFVAEPAFKGTAWVDRDRLQRAIVNILSNAEDATPKGGEVHLTISSDDGLLIFSIRDGGNGIPEEVRHRVFEPFVTYGKSRGTGLGLAITKRIVEQHFGEIHFETEQGKGTTFLIKIPLRPPSMKWVA